MEMKRHFTEQEIQQVFSLLQLESDEKRHALALRLGIESDAKTKKIEYVIADKTTKAIEEGGTKNARLE